LVSQVELSTAAFFIGKSVGFDFTERVCNLIPLGSQMGQTLAWSVFLSSSFLVLASSKFKVEETFSAIANEQCTALSATAEQLQSLLSKDESFRKKFKVSEFLKKVVIVGPSQDNSNLINSMKQIWGVKKVYSLSSTKLYDHTENKEYSIPQVAK